MRKSSKTDLRKSPSAPIQPLATAGRLQLNFGVLQALYLTVEVSQRAVKIADQLRGSRDDGLKAYGVSHVTLDVRKAPRLNCYRPKSARGPDKSGSLHDKDGTSKNARSGARRQN